MEKSKNYFNLLNNNNLNVFILNCLILIIVNKCNVVNTNEISSYHLLGVNSYAQYAAWQSCLNGSIKFEFKTHEPNGMLLYAQNSPYKYIQLSIADGHLRMRFRISEKDDPRGIFLIHNQKINDQKWHQILIKRENKQTLLTIDDEFNYYHIHKDSSIEGYDLFFGDPDYYSSINLFLIGGIPNYIQTYDLSLSTALFETPFNGFIRNMRISNCSNNLIKIDVLSSNGLRFTSDFNPCQSNPCLNTGVCLVKDTSFTCDCDHTNFEGRICETLKLPKSDLEVTLHGKEYFSFEFLNKDNHMLNDEEIFIEFKTSRSSGLLLFSGDTQNYFVIGLQNEALILKLNLNGVLYEKSIVLSGTYFHNNYWHSIKILRRLNQLEITTDNLKKDEEILEKDINSLINQQIFIGGLPKHKNIIHKAIRKNFIGCLRNVTYKSNHISLNLIDFNNNQIKRVGYVKKGCNSVHEPITISSQESFIPIYTWQDYPRLNKFKIEFQTSENNGLLVYSLGKNGQFFGIEIHNRFLNSYFNFGFDKYIRHEVTRESVSSGRAHQLEIEIESGHILFRFDEKTETFLMINNTLSIDGPLIVGGIYPNHTRTHIPPYFYSGILLNGFVGCIHDLEINGKYLNLKQAALNEGVSGVGTDMCVQMPNQCDIGHCMNDGLCNEGWNRFKCDCSATGYNGPICNQPATIANFENGQFMRIQFRPEWISEAEHISFRFKTSIKTDTTLLSTYSSRNKDYMEFTLDDSKLKLVIKIGHNEIVLYSQSGLNDNNWHTVVLIREGIRTILQVDGHEPATDFSDDTNNIQLIYETIDLGFKFHPRLSQMKILPHFVGQMQQLIINGQSYFELADNDNLYPNLNSTTTFYRSQIPHKYPVSFLNDESCLILPKIGSFQKSLMIQFHFKTSQENGLIFYQPGENDDFLAIELINGQLRYSFSLGDGIHRLESKMKQKLNDNRWHLVSIWRSTKTDHELSVDAHTFKHSLAPSGHLDFNLVDNFYLGGLKDHNSFEKLVRKGHIMLNHGFKGCLASIEINSRLPDFDEIFENTEHAVVGQIKRGCEEFACEQGFCKNNGVCKQSWNEDEFECDCTLTTFSGKYCTKKSNGYSFSGNDSFILYEDDIDTNDDLRILFGFETKSDNANILQYSSKSENIYLDLINGKLQVTYKINETEYQILFDTNNINDLKYHVFSAQKHKNLLRIKLNSKEEIIEIPTHTEYISNEASKVNINIGGGNIYSGDFNNEKKSFLIKEPFNGFIYGFLFNNISIFDLAAQNDNRIRFYGKVTKHKDNSIVLIECNEYTQSNDVDCESLSNKNTESYTNEIVLPKLSTKMSSREFITTTSSKAITKTKEIKYMDFSKSTKDSSKQMVDKLTTTTALNPYSVTTIQTSPKFNSTLITIGIIISSLLLLFLILYVLYKIRNRDEGTYKIDETKSFGPFSDVNTNNNNNDSTSSTTSRSGLLNCAGSKEKKSSKYQNKNNYYDSNKEWLV